MGTNDKISTNKMTAEDYPHAFRRLAAELEEKISYTFKNKEIYYEALTHSSYAHEYSPKTGKNVECNERLECLGDSVLALAVAKYIYSRPEEYPEGDMTRIRAACVCEDALFEYATALDYGKYLLLGRGEEMSAGRQRKSILSDAFEALIAALYLDGGEAVAEKFILDSAKNRLTGFIKKGSFCDYKSLLQQIVQNSPGEKLQYTIIGETGPDHDKVFETAVLLNSNVIGTGKGKSKRESEQMAAKAALTLFGEE